MAEYLREFSESSGKPVVVSSASINASAAYEISCAGGLHLHGQDHVHRRHRHRHCRSPTCPGLHGQAGHHRRQRRLGGHQGLQLRHAPAHRGGARLLPGHGRTRSTRRSSRPSPRAAAWTVEAVRALATGLTFTGIDAVENGLADEIGTLRGRRRPRPPSWPASTVVRHREALAARLRATLSDLAGASVRSAVCRPDDLGPGS